MLSCGPQRQAAEDVTPQALLHAHALRLAAEASLANLYDPLAMPAQLLRARQTLDHAVDCTGCSATSARARGRVELPFACYEPVTAPLAPVAATATRRRVAQD